VTGVTYKGQSLDRDEVPALWRRLDVSLILTVLGVSLFGIAMIYSTTSRALEASDRDPSLLAQRQFTFVLLGIATMAVVYLVDHEITKHFAPHLYVLGLIALTLVLIVGIELNGAKSWFDLPGFLLQPSEFMKPVVIVALSAYFAAFQGEVHFRNFLGGLVIGGLPVLLVLMQPDLGTALVFVAIVMGIFLVGGTKLRHIIFVTAAGVLVLGMALSLGLLPDAQQERIDAFLYPEENQALLYNAEQAKIAVGNGGFRGQGYLQGRQTRGNFVPEQETDFIFTAVGEEFGFIGAAGLLAAYLFIMWRIWRIAMVAKDMFGTLLCFGVLAMLTYHIFQNVGMAIGIMPITGIPLPWMSLGGSSTIGLFVLLGLVLNVNARRFTR
jgi:rod shape determining protein RodA